MKYACISLDNLPDEILLIIFKKLTNAEVIYSLTDVNKRLNKIVHDTIFTSCLTLMKYLPNESVHPLPFSMLNQFCLKILPEIHHKIKRLNIESSSILSVLRSGNYPNLNELGLYNIELDKTKELFTNENFLNNKYRSQIISLTIGNIRFKENSISDDRHEYIWTNIFTIFTNLQCLNFDPLLINYQWLSFNRSSPIVCSSNLFELHVNLHSLTDCLYLLDGRFDKLRRFYVYITIIPPCSIVTNQEKLANLKCFSLECKMVMNRDNEIILSLLHPMSNLEELNLNLTYIGRKRFVHGNDLKDFIIHMPKLNKFTFNIHSTISIENKIDLPSNKDIHYTFKDFKNSQIISSIDYFPEVKEGQCHIYSYPYIWKVYNNITNNFSADLFKCVYKVLLYDERPFEHEFFLRIAQSFPSLKELTVVNEKAQKNQRCKISNDDNENLSIIQYPHLTELDLLDAHDDYVEQFLIDTKTCLPNNVFLLVDFTVLKKITHNFTRYQTRNNASKIHYKCNLVP